MRNVVLGVVRKILQTFISKSVTTIQLITLT